MTNQEIIGRKFEVFRRGVHEGGIHALCEQMESTLHVSLNLHEQLEGGYHGHHTIESDSHGWGVADGAALAESGASLLAEPNEYGSAENDASEEAVRENPGQKGVFSAVLANPFAGGAGRGDGEVSYNPHDSIRFETKIFELLAVNARANFPYCFRKNFKISKRG